MQRVPSDLQVLWLVSWGPYYLASSLINRKLPCVSRAQVVSVLQTVGINMALIMFFGGHMDNW